MLKIPVNHMVVEACVEKQRRPDETDKEWNARAHTYEPVEGLKSFLTVEEAHGAMRGIGLWRSSGYRVTYRRRGEDSLPQAVQDTLNDILSQKSLIGDADCALDGLTVERVTQPSLDGGGFVAYIALRCQVVTKS